MTFQSFCTQAYLKSFTPINGNVDVNELDSHLEATELIYTRELIGKNLYDDIKTKFIAQILSPDEIILVGFLKQHIAYRTTYEAIPFLNVKMVAKGPSKLRGEFSEPASLKDVQWLQSSLGNRAEYFEQRIVDYLCLNGNLFPLYSTSDDVTGILLTNTNQFDSDIYLGDNIHNINNNRRFFNF